MLSFQPNAGLECFSLGECAGLWAVSLLKGDIHQGDFQGQTPLCFPAPGGLWHQGELASKMMVPELSPPVSQRAEETIGLTFYRALLRNVLLPGPGEAKSFFCQLRCWCCCCICPSAKAVLTG